MTLEELKKLIADDEGETVEVKFFFLAPIEFDDGF